MFNQFAFSRAADVIAGKHGLQVVMNNDTSHLQVKGNTITIPQLSIDASEEAAHRVLSTVDYFGSLHRYADEAQSKHLTALPPDKPIGWMYRLFNDARIMSRGAEEFLGSRRGFSAMSEANIRSMVEGGGFSELDPKMQAVIAASVEGTKHWNTASTLELESALSPEAREMKAKLDDVGLGGMASVLKSGDDPLALAKLAYHTLWEDDPEEEQQKEEKGKGGGEGGGDEEGEDESDVPANANPFNNQHEEMSKSAIGKLDEDVKPHEEGRPVKVRVDEDGRSAIRLETTSNILEERCSQSSPRYDRLSEWGGSYRIAMHNEGASAVFANKIRRFLQARAAVTYEHGQKRGKISAKNIYRIGLPMEARTKQAERVFKRKREDDTLDTAVQLMVDVSGSMMGLETVMTYKATCLLAHALTVLGVACEINAFTTTYNARSSSGGSTVVWRVKDWDERVTDDILKDRFNVLIESGMRNNNDEAALRYAYDRLLQREETRKILIMQSDGQPAAPDADGKNPSGGLKQVSKKIERDAKVDLLSVGIGFMGAEAVDRYYKNHVKVENVAELETALFDLVAKRMTS